MIATQARLDAAQLQAQSAGGLGGIADDQLDTRLTRALSRLDLLEAEETEAIAAEQQSLVEVQDGALESSTPDPDQLELDLGMGHAAAAGGADPGYAADADVVMPEAAE